MKSTPKKKKPNIGIVNLNSTVDQPLKGKEYGLMTVQEIDLNQLQKDPKELEALQDGVIDFVQKILKQRNQLIEENKELRQKKQDEREYYEKMLAMKQEKIEILKMKLDLVKREMKTDTSEASKITRSNWLVSSQVSKKRSNELRLKDSRASLRKIVDKVKSRPKRETVGPDGEIKKIPICMDNIAQTLQRIRKSYSKDRTKIQTQGYLTKLQTINRVKTAISFKTAKKDRRSLYKKSKRSDTKENACNQSTSSFFNKTACENFSLSKSFRIKMKDCKRNTMISPSNFDSRTRSFGRISLHGGRSSINLMSKKRHQRGKDRSRGRRKGELFVKKPLVNSIRLGNALQDTVMSIGKNSLKESLDRISLNGFTDHFKSCIKNKIGF